MPAPSPLWHPFLVYITLRLPWQPKTLYLFSLPFVLPPWQRPLHDCPSLSSARLLPFPWILSCACAPRPASAPCLGPSSQAPANPKPKFCPSAKHHSP